MSTYPITFDVPGWAHMRFREASLEEWRAAHPCHRFYDDGHYLVAESCSLCPHTEEAS